MGNPYFDNSDPGQRFQPGTVADGEAVDEKFDRIATGLDATYQDTQRALKFPYEEGAPSQEFTASALQRRNRVLGFDKDGNLALVSGFYARGDWQPNTKYFLNDVVRDPDTTNLYVSIAEHTSGATPDLGNAGKWYLAIDADTVRQARIEAVAARDLAIAWASQDPGPVDGTAYQSAKSYALQAQGSAYASLTSEQAVAAAETRIEGLEQNATDAANTATSKAGEASSSAQAAATSESNIKGVEQNVTTTAQQVATDAQTASDAAASAESVSQRINDTTTMDFLSFELNGPDLVAHFAGYSDASNFAVNAAGELEVTL
ncbi:hypothetical protein DFO67_108143 [Modicisalibacter xianhensis]|uniref:Uncharacterized protein n=1 Tax=Modicisalibacter xianhensis TaxID=442341 RepID=A0A4R8FRB6_9GAMM|nr:hypothetical protein [Halomonas xianhensis]TDX29099.1 hypothetical protein DFO67_108143 [Halomonas xianhensis]